MLEKKDRTEAARDAIISIISGESKKLVAATIDYLVNDL